MSVVVAEGVVELTADASGVPRKVAKDIEGDQVPVRNAGIVTGKNLIGGILGSVAVLKTIDWFGGAIDGASDLAETMNKSNTIFGTAAKVVDVWGDSATTNLGLSKAAALGAASGFGNMFTQLGYTSAAAADLSTKTVQMAADLGSFNNLPTADVADRISAALRGEYDSLQALIPNINAARVESEAMIMTGKSNASQLTAQEKAAATLAIVQRDGAAAMGDFAKTSDEFANSSKTTTAELAEMQAEVGTMLLPTLKDLLGYVRGTVIPGLSGLVDWVGKNGDTVTILSGVIAGTVVSYQVAGAAMGVYKAFQIANTAATGGLTFAQWNLNRAMTANPIGAIITIIGVLVGVIVWVATQTTFFQDAWEVMSTGIVAAWEWVWGILEPIFTRIGEVFTWLYENVLLPVFTAVMFYVGIWAAIFTWLWENILSPVFTAIGAIFTWLYENVLYPVFIGVMLYIGIWAAIITWLWEAIISPVFIAIGAIFGWLYENVILPIVGYIVGVVQAWGAIFTWLWETIISPVFSAIGVAFGWIWNTIISPFVGFMVTGLTTIGNTVSSVFGGIADFIGSAFNSALSVVRGPLNGIISLVNGAINSLNRLSVTIPDWVPEVGGQTWGLNLPTIPMLARGSRNAPDTFIAGENGPELITGAKGSRVYSNNETRDLLSGAGGGVTYHIESITLDAKNVREFTDVVEMIEALPQVARAGRGQLRMGT